MTATTPTMALINANVIMTFESGPQAFFDVMVTVPVAEKDVIAFEDIETDIAEQIIGQTPNDHDLSELVKISLCYTGRTGLSGQELDGDTAKKVDTLIEFLVRHDAKYYFQPDQRDDYEQRIVDRTGVAKETQKIGS